MKIYCTGPNGYVGKALVKAGVFPLCSDVTDKTGLEQEVAKEKPDLILHLAAKSNVDWCEKKDNQEVVIRTNLRGIFNVCTLGIPTVLFSTDQIWAGGWTEPWWTKHTEIGKKTLPVNYYAATKVAAEGVAYAFDHCKIIRTSFLFSSDRAEIEEKISTLKAGFVVFAPTFIKRSFMHRDHFILMLKRYCDRFQEMPKVLHLSGRQTVSWHKFMLEVCEQYGFQKRLVKARREDLGLFAPRPHNGGLDIRLSQELGFKTYDYIDGIKRMKNES